MSPPVITERLDGLYLDSPGATRRITALRVGAYDYDSLAAKQREGEVILYWAAAPALSPDGRVVAYASNREAVARGTSGQSIWLLDLDTGTERVLLDHPARSYRPIGWLGDEVAYIGDAPGVWLVHPGTGATRVIAPGTYLAVTRDGSAIAVADDVPEDPKPRVITTTRAIDVPAAPDGSRWLADASFDSAGVLQLQATADSGRTRTRFAFDPETGRLTPRP